MCDIKNASLILKTTDLTINANSILNGNIYTSSSGSNNNKLSSFTWNNINLRTVLGDMYDQYDEFNLCLNTISTSQCPNFDQNATDNKNVYIKISGLPFLNQTYSVKNNCNSNSTVIATFNFVNTTAVTQFFYSNNVATFGKSQDTCNLTIEYWSILYDTVLQIRSELGLLEKTKIIILTLNDFYMYNEKNSKAKCKLLVSTCYETPSLILTLLYSDFSI
jgi:hypothetical protein